MEQEQQCHHHLQPEPESVHHLSSITPRLPYEELEQSSDGNETHPHPTQSIQSDERPTRSSRSHSPSIQSKHSFHPSNPKPIILSSLRPCSPSVSSLLNRPPSRKNSKAPLSSSARSRILVCQSSASTSELEHGFTTDDDLDHRTPFLSDLTLQSLAGAPMPAVHEILAQQQLFQPSDRSSPSRLDPQSSPNPDHPIPNIDHHSSSSRLSRPSRLSDENLQRQSTGIKERVKKSVKMRETERWARETISSSQQPSPSSVNNNNNTAPSSELQDRNPMLSLPPNANIHSSPSPETLPRPRLSVQPVPSFRAIPVTDPGAESVVLSEHATINDWQSENTNFTHLMGSSQHPARSLFPLSPIDVQFIGQTPTSVEFQSLNHIFTPPIVPGTVIGSIDEHTSMVMALPLQFAPFPATPDHRPSQHSSPRIEEIPVTPPTTQVSKEKSDPLLQARINLQEALSTTPQARSRGPSPPTTPTGDHYHPQPSGSQNLLPNPEEENRTDGDDYDDENQDHESGLSPIKEDRTAELAAEHSWRLRHMLGSPHSSHHSSNQLTNQLKSSVSMHPLDHTEHDEIQPLNFSYPHRCKSDNPIHNSHPKSTNDRSIPSISLVDSKADTTAQPSTSNDLNLALSSEEIANKLSAKSELNESLACSNDDERNSHHTITNSALSSDEVVLQKSQPLSPDPKELNHPDPVPASPPPPATSIAPQTAQLQPPPQPESLSSRRQASPLRVRTGPHQKPNPPLSVPASARRPPPEDLLNRLEMEEWRNQTGIDDRYSLSLRPVNGASLAAGGSLSINSPFESDRAGLVGLGGEERRGIKDRWGNSWGLESHILSPLSEHTELTTVGSILSLSTRKSNHSLRSLDSTSNSIAQRLEQADTNPMRMMKLGTAYIPSGVIRGVQPNGPSRTASGPINRIDSPSKPSPLNTMNEFPKDAATLEDKLKRKEERRVRREKRDRRRAQALLSSESLAQKQERRRLEKKRKEEFLEKKHQLLQRLQETGENATLVRDLGILYMTSNVGVAGLKLAVRHLEMSLQMDDSDPLSWSCLGKTWAYLYGMAETEVLKLAHTQEANKAQQAHNAAIGLRKAIINSRTYGEVIKYKIEWARFLEKMGRWRDSLGLIGELIKNVGKTQAKCWAALGFIGARLVFGWPALDNLETDDLDQGFPPGDCPPDLFERNTAGTLSDSDRRKLLSQVHNAFERASTLLDEQIASAHLTHLNVPDAGPMEVENIDMLKAYKAHFELQLTKIRAVEGHLDHLDRAPRLGLTPDVAPHHPSNLGPADSRRTDGLGNIAGSGIPSSSEPRDIPSELPHRQPEEMGSHAQSNLKDSELVVEEIRECTSPSHPTSTPRSALPVFKDLDPNADQLKERKASSFGPPTGDDRCDTTMYTPSSRCNFSAQGSGPTYLDEPTPTSQVERTGDPQGPANAEGRLQEAPKEGEREGRVSGGRPAAGAPEACPEEPDVTVQYDDVDTTNDYSEGRNSDPFRPSSNLGLYFVGHSPARPLPPDLLAPSSLAADPAFRLPEDLQPSEPAPAAAELEPASAAAELEPASAAAEPQPPPPLPTPGPPQGLDDPPARHPPSPIEEKSMADDGRNGGSFSPDERPTTPDEPMPDGPALALLPPAHISPPDAQNSSPPQPLQALPTVDDSTGLDSQTFSSPPRAVDLQNHKRSSLSSSSSQPPPDHRELSISQKISTMGLSSPVERKLRGLDREKLIAFLELDRDYHTRAARLRKKLIRIEEEREQKRKEMFARLGIEEGTDGGGSAGEEESTECESEEEEGAEAMGVGAIEAAAKAAGMGDGAGGCAAERARMLGSSMGSIRSTSSLPTRGPPRGRRAHLNHTGRRSVCSPLAPAPRSECFLPNPGLDPALPQLSTGPIDTHAPTLDLHGPASGSHQANIALQGIAAILKLATSTQSH